MVSPRKKPSGDCGDNDGALGFEATIWQAAESLRHNVDSTEYKHAVLGLIFLKYISDTFEEWQVELLAEQHDVAALEDPDAERPAGIFWVPQDARWAKLHAQADAANIGLVIDDAMATVERHNDRLQGILPKHYARLALEREHLSELVRLVGSIEFCHQQPQEKENVETMASAEQVQCDDDDQTVCVAIQDDQQEVEDARETVGDNASAAVVSFVKNEKLSLQTHPTIDAEWVRAQIAADPTILGLGELALKHEEQSPPQADRSELLLRDVDTHRSYAIGVQLGKTDERHVVRTLEQWDRERNRFPQDAHCAVIVAEEISARFLNVLRLFNGSVPLAAIQVSALKVGDQLTLLFTTVLSELAFDVTEN